MQLKTSHRGNSLNYEGYLELNSKKIDYAQEGKNIIIHFSPDDEPVMLEILDASKFLTDITRATITSEKDTPVSIK